jgi:hypothetical protein
MQFSEVVKLAVRLAIFGPLMYAALRAALDPAWVIPPLNKVALEAYRIDALLFRWREPSSDLVADTPGMRTALRVAGALTTVFCLAHLSGLA